MQDGAEPVERRAGSGRQLIRTSCRLAPRRATPHLASSRLAAPRFVLLRFAQLALRISLKFRAGPAEEVVVRIATSVGPQGISSVASRHTVPPSVTR